MNIVIIGFDCNPHGESEALITWKTTEYFLMRNYNITLITKESYHDDIENEIKQKNIKNLIVEYCSCPKWSKRYGVQKNFILKFIALNKYIQEFFDECFEKLLIIEKKIKIDVIYRVTPNSYRSVINLSHFHDCIKLMGPCGGAQEMPKKLLRNLSFKNKLIEYFHRASNFIAFNSKKKINAYNSYDYIFCCNIETYNCFCNKIDKNKLVLLSDVGIDNIYNNSSKENHDYLTILWVGRMIYRKGLDYLIDAVNNLSVKKVKIIIVGDGPEMTNIKNKISTYNLEKIITLTGRLTRNETLEYYQKADLFVFPSLRESGGNVLLESISNGVPVLAFDIGGAPLILGNSGILINMKNKSRNDIISEMNHIIDKATNDKSFLLNYKDNTYKNAEILKWKNKIEIIDAKIKRRENDS